MSRGAKAEETMTKALARFLAKRLVPDLQERARTPSVAEALRHRWDHERAARRTADEYESWSARLVEQVGAAWVLSCAFVRTLEDRGYLAQRRLAGPGAGDSEHYFFELFPQLGVRDYLLAVFREMSHLPGAADLFGPQHNAAWRLAPSNVVAQELLALWRSTAEERTPTWTFEGTDTRFLGDLYQWLSEDARERFALLQTPDFVEEFILDLTLNPAIDEFGLETVRLIDPTCGSGHFLLGAFDRLFERRSAAKPGLDRRTHALAALAQVHGVDINPYAVEIARFRLTLSFLEKAGITRLADAPELKPNLVVADSLLHGAGQGRLASLAEDKTEWGDAQFTLDDEGEAQRILGQGYHAVVGNPPYITCKDGVLRELYRELYPKSAAGKFALAAPFTERFFQLGIEGGFVGLINANSFMKREFGKKLIQEVLPSLDLSRVIDSAGAYIPGHGTPTTILIGRHRQPVGKSVLVVMGKRGEPEVPADPATGLVWSSIVSHLNEVGFENDFISVAEVPRVTLNRHPWSLGGGGASELKSDLERRATKRLADVAASIGVAAVTGEDDLYVADDSNALLRRGIPSGCIAPFGVGESIREWHCDTLVVFHPYAAGVRLPSLSAELERSLWPWRTGLRGRVYFGKTQRERGLEWWEYAILVQGAATPGPRIAFAFVSTHNQFVFDRGGTIFNRTAPVIKLPESATEGDHIALLGYLSSSTVAFWCRNAFFSKGAGKIGSGGRITAEPWEDFLEYTGTQLQKLPLYDCPASVEVSRRLESGAKVRVRFAPREVLAASHRSVAESLQSARNEDTQALETMCADQEELDWECYRAAGLLSATDAEAARNGWAVARRAGRLRMSCGHRPFEIILAREAARNGTHTAWFERNGYASPDEISSRYPKEVRDLLATLVAIVDSNSLIALIEKPEYKRRWTLRDYDAETKAAATEYLLDALEEQVRSGGSAPVRSRGVADAVLRNEKAREIAEILFGPNEDLAARLAAVPEKSQVPHLAALRFMPSGLEKRAAWERSWELQRLEDAGTLNEAIPAAPKYDPKDYVNAMYWRLRGKLDVPKERFISYPGAERDGDNSPLIGWAGWDHLERAQALSSVYEERKTEDGWPKERLVPLLAGILELVPWVKQWHNAPNPEFGDQRLGDYFEDYVTAEASALGVTLDDLRAWRPASAKAKRGRNAKESA